MTTDNNLIIATLCEALEAPALAPESLLADQPSPWDSIAVLGAMMGIEEAAGVSIPGERLARCTTVADVLALVQEAKP